MRKALIILLLTSAASCDLGITEPQTRRSRPHHCIGSRDACRGPSLPSGFNFDPTAGSTVIRGTVYVGEEAGGDSLEILVEFDDAAEGFPLISTTVDSLGRYEASIERKHCGTDRTWVGVKARPIGSSHEPYVEVRERALAFDSVPSPCPDSVRAQDIVLDPT